MSEGFFGLMVLVGRPVFVGVIAVPSQSVFGAVVT